MIEKDFLDAIAADPEDEVARFIFADWLEEQGNPHGEFIRLQCALEEMDPEADGFEELDDRMRELLIAHEEEWTSSIRDFVDVWRFHKGFLDYAEIDVNAFLSHAEMLFSAGLFRYVHFRNVGEETDQLARCKWLARIQGLSLDDCRLGDGRTQKIFNSQHLHNLRRLSLSQNGIGDAGLRAVAACRLPNLELLDASENKIRNEGITAFVNSPNARNLKALILDENQIRQTGALALAESPNLNQLELLDIRRNLMSEAGITALEKRFQEPCVLYT